MLCVIINQPSHNVQNVTMRCEHRKTKKTHKSFCKHKHSVSRKQPNGRQRERGDTDEEVSRIPTCWDSDVVLLLGSASVGDVGTLPLESVMSNVRLSLTAFSHLVTRNL